MKSHDATTDSLFYTAATNSLAMDCHEHLLPIMGAATLSGSFSPLHSGALSGAPGLHHTPHIIVF